MHGRKPRGWWRVGCAAVASFLFVLFTPAPALAASEFRARGNEPGWSVTISDTAIELRTMDGKSAVVSSVPKAHKSGAAETYTGQADGRPFSMTISEALCTDTMSGMSHPKSVSVTWGDLVLTGCSGDPLTLIQGEWAIESINGRAVPPAAKPVLSFDAKGGLAGGGICNRFFGGYELTGEGLTFGGMGSTQMACEQALMEEEALLLKALGKVSAFGIDSSGVLTLKGAQTVIVARRKQY